VEVAVKKWKETGDALADAMAALQVERMEKIEDMRADGWFTALEFAERAGIDRQTAKARLDKSDKVERCKVRVANQPTTAYRLKR
jgi:hypothetical protein